MRIPLELNTKNGTHRDIKSSDATLTN